MPRLKKKKDVAIKDRGRPNYKKEVAKMKKQGKSKGYIARKLKRMMDGR